jgi:hypothetical protein
MNGLAFEAARWYNIKRCRAMSPKCWRQIEVLYHAIVGQTGEHVSGCLRAPIRKCAAGSRACSIKEKLGGLGRARRAPLCTSFSKVRLAKSDLIAVRSPCGRGSGRSWRRHRSWSPLNRRRRSRAIGRWLPYAILVIVASTSRSSISVRSRITIRHVAVRRVRVRIHAESEAESDAWTVKARPVVAAISARRDIAATTAKSARRKATPTRMAAKSAAARSESRRST